MGQNYSLCFTTLSLSPTIDVRATFGEYKFNPLSNHLSLSLSFSNFWQQSPVSPLSSFLFFNFLVFNKPLVIHIFDIPAGYSAAMATAVCRGLQSCIDPHHLPEPPTVLHLHLTPRPKPCFPEPVITQCKSFAGGGGWSFLQALAAATQSPTTAAPDRESPYVPPTAKRSCPALRGRSLDLCTENLGSETGSDTAGTDGNSDFPLSLPEFQEAPATPRCHAVSVKSSHTCDFQLHEALAKPRRHVGSGPRLFGSRDFPPPLTSSLRVQRRRDGGRLIIEAVEALPPQKYFQAERTDGRLRLCFLRDSDEPDMDSSMAGQEEEESDIEEVESEGEEEAEEEEADEDEEEEEEEEEESEEENDRDMDGNSFEVGGEIGMKNFVGRPSRCKEGGHGNKDFCNWELLWVASS
ncbi:hypothetical protein NMG60_11029866 [Bertholletia excelsa]